MSPFQPSWIRKQTLTGTAVDLTTLSAQQLTAVKKQLDGEVEHLSNSYAQLAAALSKFKECLRVVKEGSSSFDSAYSFGHFSSFTCSRWSRSLFFSLRDICSSAAIKQHNQQPITLKIFNTNTQPEAKPILVPLTNSLYVKGNLADPDKVLVDVGTGFYVEKDTKSAADFYEAKIKDLTGNIQGLEGIVQAKTNNLRVVEEVLRQKVLAQGGPGASGQASS
ncbi:subunit of tubulin prefoldin [Collariella sp. IMI 366227]|nr:subunit of tubulin prefoldin [Collariella sp. IMI 366227]